ncbi:hypothetical protein CLF_108247 [Clonorchis sinensis]|uniref:Uncharacterized protein n=1 Tax=Clonorchis sinensis TaxID=79923 RepID=G7YHT5_CLOSI|nr:hypothetical protein CLF_108247 [Clonorchis sinensis]
MYNPSKSDFHVSSIDLSNFENSQTVIRTERLGTCEPVVKYANFLIAECHDGQTYSYALSAWVNVASYLKDNGLPFIVFAGIHSSTFFAVSSARFRMSVDLYIDRFIPELADALSTETKDPKITVDLLVQAIILPFFQKRRSAVCLPRGKLMVDFTSAHRRFFTQQTATFEQRNSRPGKGTSEELTGPSYVKTLSPKPDFQKEKCIISYHSYTLRTHPSKHITKQSCSGQLTKCLLNPFVHSSKWVSTLKLQSNCYKDLSVIYFPRDPQTDQKNTFDLTLASPYLCKFPWLTQKTPLLTELQVPAQSSQTRRRYGAVQKPKHGSAMMAQHWHTQFDSTPATNPLLLSTVPFRPLGPLPATTKKLMLNSECNLMIMPACWSRFVTILWRIVTTITIPKRLTQDVHVRADHGPKYGFAMTPPNLIPNYFLSYFMTGVQTASEFDEAISVDFQAVFPTKINNFLYGLRSGSSVATISLFLCPNPQQRHQNFDIYSYQRTVQGQEYTIPLVETKFYALRFQRCPENVMNQEAPTLQNNTLHRPNYSALDDTFYTGKVRIQVPAFIRVFTDSRIDTQDRGFRSSSPG